MTAEGVRRVAAVRATLLPQQAEPTGSGNGSGTSPAAGAAEKQQQQQQQAANGQGAGVAVAVQPVAAVPAPAGPAVFASIQAEAAAGAAAAAAAILSAPTAAAASPAAAAAAAAPAAAPDTAAFNPAQQSASFRRFLAMIRGDSHEFEAQGRVLRLRQYLRPDVGPRVRPAGTAGHLCSGDAATPSLVHCRGRGSGGGLLPKPRLVGPRFPPLVALHTCPRDPRSGAGGGF